MLVFCLANHKFRVESFEFVLEWCLSWAIRCLAMIGHALFAVLVVVLAVALSREFQR